MNDDFDPQRLAEIPDPFSAAATSPPRRVDPTRIVHSPTRSRVQAIRALAAAAALAYCAAWPAFFRRRPDLASVPPQRLALEMAIPLVTAAMALGVVGRLGRSGFGERKARILALGIASPLLFAVATLATMPQPHGDHFWRHAAGCMLVTAILSAGPLAVGIYAFRHAFATFSAWRTAALGLASGALAAVTIALACPIDDRWHVLVGHGSMMLVAGAIGALLGRRICRA